MSIATVLLVVFVDGGGWGRGKTETETKEERENSEHKTVVETLTLQVWKREIEPKEGLFCTKLQLNRKHA